MSHASECPNHGPVFEVEDIGCPYCDAIRKAYQHGREDAAQAVMNHVAPDNCLGDDCCVAAALGGNK